MKNLELKAIYPNQQALDIVKSMEITSVFELKQEDIYFNTPNGRLKLRSINDEQFELICYSRADKAESKYSDYEIVSFKEKSSILNLLTLAMGIKTIVCKCRKAYIINNIRIHIDNVKDLGEFIEFEIVINDTIEEKTASETMKKLINKFNIQNNQLISVSYCDLMLNQQSP